MFKENPEQQMRNMQARYTQAQVDQIAADTDKWVELVQKHTEVEDKIILAENLGLAVSQELREEHDRLADMLWRVNEIQQGKEN